MPKRFFELYDDLYIRGRWHLKNPIDGKGSRLDDWEFRLGTPVSFEGRLKILIELDHMRIAKAQVGEAKVFRPEGWPGALIVSEEIKDALERMGATGTKFEEV